MTSYSSFENFYVMTSRVTSRCLDRLSVWKLGRTMQ